VEQRSHSLEYVARRSRRRPHRLEPVRPGAAGRKLRAGPRSESLAPDGNGSDGGEQSASPMTRLPPPTTRISPRGFSCCPRQSARPAE
jgi:hypothetical protein